jgi:hypothetical protein
MPAVPQTAGQSSCSPCLPVAHYSEQGLAHGLPGKRAEADRGRCTSKRDHCRPNSKGRCLPAVSLLPAHRRPDPRHKSPGLPLVLLEGKLRGGRCRRSHGGAACPIGRPASRRPNSAGTYRVLSPGRSGRQRAIPRCPEAAMMSTEAVAAGTVWLTSGPASASGEPPAWLPRQR